MSNTKIAIASCARFKDNERQTIWNDIAAAEPDYLFLIGDMIYMDFGLIGKEKNGAPKEYTLQEFSRIMDKKYENQWHEPAFQKLFNKLIANKRVFSIWDDHDFAWNNAQGGQMSSGDSLKKKIISRDLFHKWHKNSTNLPEVYFYVDIPNARVFFIDNRFYADYENGILLGNAQKNYIQSHINHDQPYTFICSGITFDSGKEHWTNYPADKKWLLNLLQQQNKTTLFISGDIHENDYITPTIKHPFYEIITSGVFVNKLGMPFGISNRRNWALIELDNNKIDINLTSLQGKSKYTILNGG